MNPERRYAVLEYREAGDGPGTVEGLAVPYGIEAEVFPGLRERFEGGALADQVTANINANIQHQRARPLARNGRGLKLVEAPEGLRAVLLTLPDTSDGRDAAVMLRDGVLTGFSVEFLPTRESGGDGIRRIERAELAGLALVDDPAHPGAEAHLRELRQRYEGNPGRRPIPGYLL